MLPSVNINSFSSFHVIQEVESKVEYAEEASTADFETAVHFARHGKFQTILLGVSGTIYATCAISTTTLSFVLPSAECDFNLSSANKGRLSAMPLIGMIFGCSIWASMANSHGRKVAIMSALLVDFLAAAISSSAQSFEMFLVCRFFNGFGIIGATSIVFTYLGEFLSIKQRDVTLGKLEIYWNVGIMILPGVAWLFLNERFLKYFTLHQNFSPWRIFVLVCSLPSLISLVMLYFLPETPKFYMAKDNYEKARLVFQKMYACNTGESMRLYPVLNLEGEYENNNNKFIKKLPLIHRIKGKCKKILEMLTLLCSQPYLKYIGITGFADFGLMASYYTLVMWFPEIFERFYDYELQHPNSTAGVCIVSQRSASEDGNLFVSKPCDPSIENRVFLYTAIIALSCIPTSVSLGYFMHKFGKKKVLITGLILSGISTLLLNFVQNTTQTLIVSCLFEALTSVLEAVLFCVVVDLFPTNLRAVAVALTATSGRLGAIFGNILFGLLIDLNCVVPIYSFGLFLIASGLLCIAIPGKENYIVLD